MAEGDKLGWAILSALFSPFLSFGIIGLITRRNGKVSAIISISAIGLSLGLSLYSLGFLPELSLAPRFLEAIWLPQGNGGISVGIVLDPLSILMLSIVALVAFCVQLYSLGYMSGESPPSLGRYYAYHSLFAFSMMGLVLSKNILETYIFWELVGLCSYLLIGFWYSRPQAARAAVKAFWVTRGGDVGFMIGILLAFKALGTFDIPRINESASIGLLSPGWITAISLLIFCGAVGKSAQFPLHVWLPDAMEGPTPVSALIHAATMVAAGVYLVARMFPLFSSSHEAMMVVATIGGFTAIFAASMAFVEMDIKRVLAYSTISQLGYMMAALGLGGRGEGFFHLMTHAYFKALLFLCAGSIIHALGTNDMREMGGLFRKMPMTAVSFGIGMLALSGIFPFSGYFSKEGILSIAAGAGFKIPFLLLLATTFMTAFYMGRAYVLAFLGRPRWEGHPHEAPAVMTVPMAILALLSLISGSFEHNVVGLLGMGSRSHSTAIPVSSTILVLAGFAVSYAIYSPGFKRAESIAKALKPAYDLLLNRYFIDDFYSYIYGRIMLGLSAVTYWFDRHVVDGIVNLVSYTTLRIGRAMRAMQSGVVEDYAVYIIAGLLILAILAISFL
jgi:NADH-quinone oxidoreductase subunit L